MPKRVKRKNKEKDASHIFRGIVVVLVAIIILFVLVSVVKSAESRKNAEIAQKLSVCMSEKGVIFYGRLTCPYCQAQIGLFGQAFKSINFINCDIEPNLCSGLAGVPAWKINGNIVYGVQSLDKLSKLSNCDIN